MCSRSGRPRRSISGPRNRFVADFLGTANFFDGVLERNGEGFHIRLEHGDVVACADPGMTAGKEVSAIVRPERIMLASDGAEDGLPARVSDVIYLGQSVRYHLETRQGHEIVAASTDRGIRFAPGEPVRLTWPRDDVWVIPEAAGQAVREAPLRL